ncbi:MAG: sugar nucleotide-binding protein [Candidatus Hodarchaeales archaeon]|jgi:dTDP-4-dehydrorhamnose reductase
MALEEKEKLILVLGGSGFVSQWVVDALSLNYNFALTYFKNNKILEYNPEYLWVKFKSSDNLEKLINNINPDMIFNFLLSGMTENNFDKNSVLNKKYSNFVEFNKNLIKIINEKLITTVFLSSDHVFPGKDGLYNETAQLDPFTSIGKIYADIESLYNLSMDNGLAIIIRSSLLLGMSPTQIVQKNLLEIIQSSKKIINKYQFIKNCYRTPSHIMNLVSILGKILDNDLKKGIFHIPGEYLNYKELFLKILGNQEQESTNVDWSKQFVDYNREIRLGLNAYETLNNLNIKPITLSEGFNIKI